MGRILIIESDQPLASNLTAYLKKAGHQVEWHVDPQTAMDAIEAQQPDLLVLDLLLAGRSGVEFLYEFRSYPDWQKLPVVVFSSVSGGELGQSVHQGLKQLEVAAFHYKPDTNLAELAQTIDRLLQAARV